MFTFLSVFLRSSGQHSQTLLVHLLVSNLWKTANTNAPIPPVGENQLVERVTRTVRRESTCGEVHVALVHVHTCTHARLWYMYLNWVHEMHGRTHTHTHTTKISPQTWTSPETAKLKKIKSPKVYTISIKFKLLVSVGSECPITRSVWRACWLTVTCCRPEEPGQAWMDECLWTCVCRWPLWISLVWRCTHTPNVCIHTMTLSVTKRSVPQTTQLCSCVWTLCTDRHDKWVDKDGYCPHLDPLSH